MTRLSFNRRILQLDINWVFGDMVGAYCCEPTLSGVIMLDNFDWRWCMTAFLIILAASLTYSVRRRPALLLVGMFISPLPAFIFVRLTAIASDDVSASQQVYGILLSAFACYGSVWLGLFTSYLMRLLEN